MRPSDWVGMLLLFGPALVLAPVPWLAGRWRPGLGGWGRLGSGLAAVVVFAVVELSLFGAISDWAAGYRADAVMVSFHMIFGLLVAAVVVIVAVLFGALMRRAAP